MGNCRSVCSLLTPLFVVPSEITAAFSRRRAWPGNPRRLSKSCVCRTGVRETWTCAAVLDCAVVTCHAGAVILRRNLAKVC